MWQQWINFMVGLWIILSAYVGFSATGMTTNLVLSGIVVAGLALWGALAYPSNAEKYTHRHA